MEGIKILWRKMPRRKKTKYKRCLKSKEKKNGFKVTVTNFCHIKTFFTLLSQEILQDFFIFILIELQENTKTWRIFAWFPPLVIVILSKAWTRALIHFVKTSTAFNPTMDPQKKSNLSLSCLAYAGSTLRQYWLLDVSAWTTTYRQVS